jgi:hypothetical protein
MSVSAVEPFQLSSSQYTIIEVLRELKKVSSITGLNVQDDMRLEKFCETISAGDLSERHQPARDDIASLSQSTYALRNMLENAAIESADYDGSSDESLFAAVVHTYCHNRSFFISETGEFGIGPIFTKPGDIAVVLLGLKSVMILRPVPDDKFQVVGEGYIHGFMDGEALLGPLPDQYQNVRRLDGGDGLYWPEHLDRDNGDFLPEDPRLGELPSGWSR